MFGEGLIELKLRLYENILKSMTLLSEIYNASLYRIFSIDEQD